jgi:hypothetical protein
MRSGYGLRALAALRRGMAAVLPALAGTAVPAAY